MIFLAATDGGSPNTGIPKAWPDSGCAIGTTTFRNAYDSGANYPAVGMTWCAAYAYCEWAGKRLCRSETRDASAGEWWAACSNAGTRAYSYADVYDSTTCNTETLELAPSGSFAGCQGGAPGLLDMSGNVNELVDSCNSGDCYSMGGDYTSYSFTRCNNQLDVSQVSAAFPSVGFRCCADKQ